MQNITVRSLNNLHSLEEVVGSYKRTLLSYWNFTIWTFNLWTKHKYTVFQY